MNNSPNIPKHNELTFQLMVDAAPNALILINKCGKIAYANSQAENLFQYHRNQLIGNGINVLLPENAKKKHPSFVNHFFLNPEARIMGEGRELYATRKDGSIFPVEIGLNPIATCDGMLVLASIIDITRRKKLEEVREKYTRKLELKHKELEQFTYIASHDLQEPVRNIGSLAEILKQDYHDKLDSIGQTSLEFMKSSANRMQNLIKSLLDYSRLGQKSKPMHTDLNYLLESVLSDLTKQIKEANASIKISKMPTILVYDTEVRLLFQNLISNALKYKKDKVNPIISISHKKTEEGHHFIIKDNGIGIEDRFKEKIFVIFQRLHKDEQYEGTGIGLSHCKKIVELHDGDIWVNSENGNGSEFHFTIKNNFEIF